MKMISSADNTVNVTVYKPGKNGALHNLLLRALAGFHVGQRRSEYMGRQINGRELEVNNGDFTCSNSLYSHEFFKDRNSILWLKSMNAPYYPPMTPLSKLSSSLPSNWVCAIASRTLR
jgi:hypothetical protein